METTTATFRLNKELYKKLKVVSVIQNKTIQSIVEECLEKYTSNKLKGTPHEINDASISENTED